MKHGHVTGQKRERRQTRRQSGTLAAYIVHSIRTHAAHGIPRIPEQYTSNPVTLAAVRTLLQQGS